MELTVANLQQSVHHQAWQKQHNYSWEEVNKAIKAATDLQKQFHQDDKAVMTQMHQAEKLHMFSEFDEQLQHLIKHCEVLQESLPEHAAVLRGLVGHIQIERRLLNIQKEMLPSSLAR